MKLTPLLSALLLSASPVVADDFLYLKCDTKIKYNMIRPYPEEGEKDHVIYYEVDLKNKILTDLAYIDETYEVKIENGVIFQIDENYDEELMVTESMQSEISYDPPGRFVASGSATSVDGSFEYTAELEGRCEASNKSEYEAAQEDDFE